MTTSRYRIQTVAKATGVPAATLRAWERRYGVPSPSRTNSSYRLYSDQDIEIIKSIKQSCDLGMTPSEAVAQLQSTPLESEEKEEVNEATELLRNRILESIHKFDPFSLEKHVRQAMLLGPARLVFDEIFSPCMSIVGDLWHQGQLSIAQEHLATEVIGNATRDLLRLVQPDYSAKQILLACIQDEFHILPLYGSALHFVQWGYRVVLLGVNTPHEALAQSVKRLKPDLVGLSVTQPPSKKGADLIKKYAKSCHGIPWLVGGRGAESIRSIVEQHGGLVCSGTPQMIRAQVETRLEAYVNAG